jgi:hypothetical protein
VRPGQDGPQRSTARPGRPLVEIPRRPSGVGSAQPTHR